MKYAAAVLSIALVIPSSASANQPDTASMKRVFTQMQTALKKKNEALFKAQWLTLSYEKNLVGGSGLAGKKVFKQGSRKGWYIKPQMAKLRSIPGQRGAPWVIPSLIWSDKKSRALDKVFVILIYKDKRWKVLGSGEKLAQVEALGQRHLSKKPLPPPKKKRSK
jgi:hypothetical protein